MSQGSFQHLKSNHLQEKEIKIPIVDPIELYGSNDSRLKLIKKQFPKLKIVARGDTIRVTGEPTEIERFSEKMEVVFGILINTILSQTASSKSL